MLPSPVIRLSSKQRQLRPTSALSPLSQFSAATGPLLRPRTPLVIPRASIYIKKVGSRDRQPSLIRRVRANISERASIPASSAPRKRKDTTAPRPVDRDPDLFDVPIRKVSSPTPLVKYKPTDPLALTRRPIDDMDSLGRSLPLTPIESTLKTLLLDVVQYIGERNPQLPPTVLRFTGGWVRDKLLGVDSHDIDVGISNMTGYQFGLLLKKYMDTPGNLDKYRQTLPDEEFKQNIVSLHKIDANPEKSKHLETVTTKIFGLDVDLVNLRKETYCEDSRNPQMEFGTPEEDALRRDATINALFYNLNESKVEDFTGQGLTDMESGIIRTPLEPFQTFQDDPLRVLRLIRFASRLGYSIDEETQAAMRNEHIGEALKLKISRERVGVELEKMLQGPDPRGALHLIDSLGLYSTIFANHMDDVQADTSSWSLAYNGLEALLSPDAGPDVARLRHFLVRDRRETYYAWMIAAFAPWSSVPGRVPKTSKSKPLPPRTVDVARDSLRSDNKSMSLIGAAAKNWRHVIEIKDFVLINTHRSSDQITPEKLRQKVGLAIRSWSTSDWRLCILLAILQGHMHGQNLQEVVKGYEKFISYIQKANLEDVYEMAPLVNGVDTMQAFGVKAGPWLKKAQDMVIAWQLSHPEITEKEPVLQMLAHQQEELGIVTK